LNCFTIPDVALCHLCLSANFRTANGLIRTRLNNKCLDTPNGNWQTRVHMWDCHSGQNQLWMRPSTWDLRIRTYNNLCLDVSGDQRSNGAPVVVHGCHDGDNQKWMYDSKGRLRPFSSPTRCLDIAGNNNGNGAQLVLWDCHDGNNQKWYQ
jgi:endo-1,4-beta-xylanase